MDGEGDTAEGGKLRGGATGHGAAGGECRQIGRERTSECGQVQGLQAVGRSHKPVLLNAGRLVGAVGR